MTLLPQIMDKTKQFVALLDDLARKDEEFGLDGLCIDLTFDIIGMSLKPPTLALHCR